MVLLLHSGTPNNDAYSLSPTGLSLLRSSPLWLPFTLFLLGCFCMANPSSPPPHISGPSTHSGLISKVKILVPTKIWHHRFASHHVSRVPLPFWLTLSLPSVEDQFLYPPPSWASRFYLIYFCFFFSCSSLHLLMPYLFF